MLPFPLIETQKPDLSLFLYHPVIRLRMKIRILALVQYGEIVTFLRTILFSLLSKLKWNKNEKQIISELNNMDGDSTGNGLGFNLHFKCHMAVFSQSDDFWFHLSLILPFYE